MRFLRFCLKTTLTSHLREGSTSHKALPIWRTVCSAGGFGQINTLQEDIFPNVSTLALHHSVLSVTRGMAQNALWLSAKCSRVLNELQHSFKDCCCDNMEVCVKSAVFIDSNVEACGVRL